VSTKDYLEKDYYKVLGVPKDASAADIKNLMDQYGRELGVKCEYCHAQSARTQQLDYASDDNPAKQTARVMIAMLDEINNKYLAQLDDQKYAVLVTCGNPPKVLSETCDVVINPVTGPEALTGSTRLKAGTATKIVLNMLTTGAMVRTGKTYGNLMVDVQTGSEKRRDRARRIVTIVTGLENDDADKLLRRARWNVKAAIVMQKAGLTHPQALSRLRKAHDFVRDAIGEDVESRLRQLLEVV